MKALKQKSIGLSIGLFFFFTPLLSMEDEAHSPILGSAFPTEVLSCAQIVDPETILVGSEKAGLSKSLFVFGTVDFDNCQPIKLASIEVSKSIFNIFSRVSDFSTTDGKSVVVYRNNTVHLWDIN